MQLATFNGKSWGLFGEILEASAEAEAFRARALSARNYDQFSEADAPQTHSAAFAAAGLFRCVVQSAGGHP